MPLSKLDTRLANLFSTRPMNNPTVKNVFPRFSDTEKKALQRVFAMSASGQFPVSGRKAIDTIDRGLRELGRVPPEAIKTGRYPDVDTIWHADIDTLNGMIADNWATYCSPGGTPDEGRPRASFLRFRALNECRAAFTRAIEERHETDCIRIISDAYLGSPPDMALRVTCEICANPRDADVRRAGFLLSFLAIVDLIAAVDTDLAGPAASSLFAPIVTATDPMRAWDEAIERLAPSPSSDGPQESPARQKAYRQRHGQKKRYDEIDARLRRLNEENRISADGRRVLMLSYIAAVLADNLNVIVADWQKNNAALGTRIFEGPARLFANYDAAIDRARLARSTRMEETQTDQSSSSSSSSMPREDQ